MGAGGFEQPDVSPGIAGLARSGGAESGAAGLVAAWSGLSEEQVERALERLGQVGRVLEVLASWSKLSEQAQAAILGIVRAEGVIEPCPLDPWVQNPPTATGLPAAQAPKRPLLPGGTEGAGGP